ncbi:hypothetical protein WJX73_004451 [Symbiochloris irregularis]|uniref:Uncharacterized protein n=1 Tax=Symbiochloris irregularis TaxID=706552 RepID=A0AAW1PR97_9CHLO
MRLQMLRGQELQPPSNFHLQDLNEAVILSSRYPIPRLGSEPPKLSNSFPFLTPDKLPCLQTQQGSGCRVHRRLGDLLLSAVSIQHYVCW